MKLVRGSPLLNRTDFLRASGLGVGALALADIGLAYATDLGKGTLRAPSVHDFTLNARATTVHLGRQIASTVAYNDMLPGPELRVKKGDRMRVAVHNQLRGTTSVHWHGLPIPFHMDGVPNLTQPPIRPGHGFNYDFTVPVAGTYWYHSHSGIQNDRGLYGPLIIEPVKETLSYDREYTLMIDDWADGLQHRSEAESNFLYECHLVPESAGSATPRLTGGPPPSQPDRYPLFLINGKPPTEPAVFAVRRGDVVRLRLINACAGTTVRVAIDGHHMRVTHADGQPVDPVDVDVIEIGMAERYDVLVHAKNPGTWQIGVGVSGEGIRTRGLLKYAGSRASTPPARFKPRTFSGRLLDFEMLHASRDIDYRLPTGKPDMVVPIALNARFGTFWMTFDGQLLDSQKPFHIPRDKHIRFILSNSGSTEIHPIHLHGNAFQVRTRAGHGPMKDTIRVYPFQTYTIDWISNNPGLWVFHCHNLYHMIRGMMQVLQVS